MWWTDALVEETVTSAYVYSHLRVNEQEILTRRPHFGGELTNENYQDWILARARRFFLILVAVGVPDQIFGIIDDCYDDDDLPISEDAVAALRLTIDGDRALDRRFYKTQFKYITRIPEDGEHIRYAEEETVPVTITGLKSALFSTKDSMDSVRLPSGSSKALLRRRVTLDSKTTEESILAEIAEMKRFSHEHVVSVYASYLQGTTFTVLSLPAPECTLKSFLMDTPKAFEALSKTQRRQTLIRWPHCLCSAVAWLHSQNGHHGNIRPSNIHVDSEFGISLGPLDGDGVLTATTKADDIESYQYAAPERWKRAVTVQSTASGKTPLAVGDRSVNRTTNGGPVSADPSHRKPIGSAGGLVSVNGLNTYAFLPSSKGAYARYRLSTAVGSEISSISPPSSRRSGTATPATYSSNSQNTLRGTDRGLTQRAPSVLSQTSSEGRRKAQKPHGIFLAAPETRSAVIQTWKSVQHDSFAADVFSLGAVILDILTVLVKKTFSSFARYRSAKNRNAGRGGGLADASFHANIGQVMLWAEQISLEAVKKVKNDESHVLQAIAPVIQVLEQKLAEYIKKFANIDPHCVSSIPAMPSQAQIRPRVVEEGVSHKSPSHMRSDHSLSKTRSRQAIRYEQPSSRSSDTRSSSTRPATAKTLVAPQSQQSLSLASFPSASSEVDTRSDTVVEGHGASPHYQSRRRQRGDSHVEAWEVPDLSTPKNERWDFLQDNDDARNHNLTMSPEDSERGGVFTYMNYSTSPSEAGEEPTIYRYPLPPSAPPPDRKLPPIPSHITTYDTAPRKAPTRHKRRGYIRRPPAGPPSDETELLRKLSRAAIGGHPPRMSSLQGSQSDDEEDDYLERAHVEKPTPPPAAKKQDVVRRDRVYRVRG